MGSNIRILSAGKYLPDNVLTNYDLEKMVETSDEWIVSRTGIKERRLARENEFTSDLAYKALLNAAEKISFDLNELDALIVATGTPDRLFPSTAARVHGLLGLKKEIASFDLLAACAGFSYAIEVARGLASQGYRYIAVVGAEVLSRFINWNDRTTCVLFGDGAGAIIFQSSDEPGFIYGKLYSNGSLEGLLEIPGGGSMLPSCTADSQEYKIKMLGREVFKYAVSELSSALNEALVKTQTKVNQLSGIFAHQANIRIINSVLERCGIPFEKSFNNIERYGNTSAASIPIIIAEYMETQGMKQNDLYAILSFGAGFVWGVHLYRHS
ncbi:MAG: ketoacyl-ACP synthase III [Actinobacteria bacterium]|nr:ketoacyl-ACP synthase III [Actinomycetota bacterium]